MLELGAQLDSILHGKGGGFAIDGLAQLEQGIRLGGLLHWVLLDAAVGISCWARLSLARAVPGSQRASLAT